jgi:hypothetical protein
MRQSYYGEPPQFVDRQPTAWEEAFAAALQEIFAAGHHELQAIIAGLNRSTVKPPDAQTWTVSEFQSVLRRVGW